MGKTRNLFKKIRDTKGIFHVKMGAIKNRSLEDPRDWGAWWAAVYGVSQSQTRLKRLSNQCHSTINSSMLSLLYGPTLISMHDYWKNHTGLYGPK